MSSRTLGILMAIACTALWALIPVVSRFGQTNLDHHQFLFWSSLFSCLAVGVLSIKGGRWRCLIRYRISEWMKVIALGFLGTYVYFLLLYKGYAGGKGMEVLVIQYTWPVFIVLLSITFFGERIRWQSTAALITGSTAVMIILTRGNFTELSASRPDLLIWVLAGAFCFALFSVLIRRMKVEPVSMMLVFFIVATIASFISMISASGFRMPEGKDWALVILSGAVVNGLSDVLWLLALRKTDASFLAPFVFLTPVLSTLYMMLFFDEVFIPAYAIGLMLILASGLINSVDITRMKLILSRTKE